jgi:hypothetical protein
MLKNMKVFYVILLIIVLINPIFVFAINSVSEWYRVSSTSIINANGTCRSVTKNSWSDFFVPTRTSTEWTTFINNKPWTSTLWSCAVNCSYNTYLWWCTASCGWWSYYSYYNITTPASWWWTCAVTQWQFAWYTWSCGEWACPPVCNWAYINTWYFCDWWSPVYSFNMSMLWSCTTSNAWAWGSWYMSYPPWYPWPLPCAPSWTVFVDNYVCSCV